MANGTLAHGGNIIAIARQRGCAPSDLIDASSNLSPLGPPPALLAHLGDHLEEIGYLPEADNLGLRQALAGRYGLDPAQVLAGSGTTEFIFALPQVLAPERAVIPTPTYGDYQRACRQAGVPVLHLPPTGDLGLDLATLASELKGGELVYLCNPNNPTGKRIPSRELHQYITGHPKAIFVVDESYLPFCREPSLLDVGVPANCLVLISFSKIYAIAGLRLGFVVGNEEIIGRLAGHERPWGVNRLAQVAGEFLLAAEPAVSSQVVTFLQEERPRFLAALQALPNLTVVPGCTHYILFRLSGSLTGATLAQRCLEHNVIIRDCANFTGLTPHYARVSLKTPEANDRILAALADALAASAG